MREQLVDIKPEIYSLLAQDCKSQSLSTAHLLISSSAKCKHYYIQIILLTADGEYKYVNCQLLKCCVCCSKHKSVKCLPWHLHCNCNTSFIEVQSKLNDIIHIQGGGCIIAALTLSPAWPPGVPLIRALCAPQTHPSPPWRPPPAPWSSPSPARPRHEWKILFCHNLMTNNFSIVTAASPGPDYNCFWSVHTQFIMSTEPYSRTGPPQV